MNSTITGLRLSSLTNKSPFILNARTTKFSPFILHDSKIRKSFATFLYSTHGSGSISSCSFEKFSESVLILNSVTYTYQNIQFEGAAQQFSSTNYDTYNITSCNFTNCAGSNYGAVFSSLILFFSSTIFTSCGLATTPIGGGIASTGSLTLTNVEFSSCSAIDGAAFHALSNVIVNGATIQQCTGTNSICHIQPAATTQIQLNSILSNGNTLTSTTTPYIFNINASTSTLDFNNSLIQLTEHVQMNINCSSFKFFNTNFTGASTQNLASITTTAQSNMTYVLIDCPTTTPAVFFSLSATQEYYIRDIQLNIPTSTTTLALFEPNITISNLQTFSTDPPTIYSNSNSIDVGDMLIYPPTIGHQWTAEANSVSPGTAVTNTGTTPNAGTTTTTTATTGTGTDTGTTATTGTGTATGAVPTATTAANTGSSLSTLEIVLIVILVIIVVFGIFAGIFICVRWHQGSMIDERYDPTQRPPVFP